LFKITTLLIQLHFFSSLLHLPLRCKAFLLAVLAGAAHHGFPYFDYRHALGAGAQVAVAGASRGGGVGVHYSLEEAEIELRLAQATEPIRHKKTVSKSRNGAGATIRKNRLKNEKTDGEQDLLVSLRGCNKRPALHQLVVGLKHDAKLWNDYAEQIPDNVKFLLCTFFDFFSLRIFCEST
jgi:hypothetical protein